MATLDELRIKQLLQSFEGPNGIASLSQAESPLSFRYQDELYPDQMQYQYPPRTDISPTQDFYQLNSISPTQDFYQPRTDISPTQDFYQPRTDISPTQDFYQPREFVNAPGAINYYQPDLTTLRGLDMDRFQGVSDMSTIDETTNDEQDQEYINQVEKSRNPFRGIMDLFRNIPTPFNLIRRGLGSLRGANQRLRNTDFGQSKTLQEYFERKKQRDQAKRGREANAAVYKEASDKGFTNDRGGFSTTSADKAGTSVGSGQFSPSTSRGRSGY